MKHLNITLPESLKDAVDDSSIMIAEEFLAKELRMTPEEVVYKYFDGASTEMDITYTPAFASVMVSNKHRADIQSVHPLDPSVSNLDAMLFINMINGASYYFYIVEVGKFGDIMSKDLHGILLAIGEKVIAEQRLKQTIERRVKEVTPSPLVVSFKKENLN